MRRAVVLVGVLGLVAACDRDEAPAPTAMPTATASGTATATASAAASATASGSATATGSAAGSAAAPSSSAPAAALTCGDKPLPPCPLQKWMKANAAPAINAPDFQALAGVLEKIATMAPQGYPNWASIARDGADAARAQVLDAVKASCRGCHKQYRDRYQKEMRDRPI